MPHIVILTPKGADVTTGKEALEAAGFEVEVVDAEAANLIHIASGMLEDEEGSKEEDSKEKDESPEDAEAELSSDESSEDELLPTPEEPDDSQLPAAADLSKKDKKPDEKKDSKKQANESYLGTVNIDDELVPAYIGKSNTLWAGGLKRNSDMLNKITFKLNESIVSVWKDAAATKLQLTVNGKPVQAKLMEAKGKTKLVVNAQTAKLLKLRK